MHVAVVIFCFSISAGESVGALGRVAAAAGRRLVRGDHAARRANAAARLQEAELSGPDALRSTDGGRQRDVGGALRARRVFDEVDRVCQTDAAGVRGEAAHHHTALIRPQHHDLLYTCVHFTSCTSVANVT